MINKLINIWNSKFFLNANRFGWEILKNRSSEITTKNQAIIAKLTNPKKALILHVNSDIWLKYWFKLYSNILLMGNITQNVEKTR